MTNEEVMQLMTDMELHEGGIENWVMDNAWVLVVNKAIEKEREAILQMFEHAPALVDFAKNDQGGCLICGFTPEIAIKSIRARGQANG